MSSVCCQDQSFRDPGSVFRASARTRNRRCGGSTNTTATATVCPPPLPPATVTRTVVVDSITDIGTSQVTLPEFTTTVAITVTGGGGAGGGADTTTGGGGGGAGGGISAILHLPCNASEAARTLLVTVGAGGVGGVANGGAGGTSQVDLSNGLFLQANGGAGGLAAGAGGAGGNASTSNPFDQPDVVELLCVQVNGTRSGRAADPTSQPGRAGVAADIEFFGFGGDGGGAGPLPGPGQDGNQGRVCLTYEFIQVLPR